MQLVHMEPWQPHPNIIYKANQKTQALNLKAQVWSGVEWTCVANRLSIDEKAISFKLSSSLRSVDVIWLLSLIRHL